MAKRKIIKIDEDKCNGCGLCVPNCAEGALKIVNGKAKLVSEVFCDGLGACLGHCPEGAITIEEREAKAFDEKKTHEHLHKTGKCPGAAEMDFRSKKGKQAGKHAGKIASQLRQWPIQLHLISPLAPYYQGADVLLSADCAAYALGGFHPDYLQGKSIAIACPKLDEGQEAYSEKITALIDEANINTLTVMIMQVPCCRGLFELAKQAAGKAKRKIPIKLFVVGIQGEILSESEE